MTFSLYRRPALERSKIMVFSSWLRHWKRPAPAPRRGTPTSPRQRARFRPRLESLEDRTVPSGFQQINLVGYTPGMAHFTDPNLNGWGMTSLPDGSFCVANAFATGLATFYDRSGHVLPRTITVPYSAGESGFLGLPAVGHPTGVVYNPTSDFKITNPDTGVTAPATLIFDSIDGTISGWNPNVDPTKAILIRDTFADYLKGEGAPAVYTGLEIGQDSQGNNVLYATDFLTPGVTDATAPQGGEVQMIGKSGNNYFATLGTFTDPSLPSFSDGSYGAWSVQAVNDKLYVTFASLKDLGGGVVDVFDTDGGNMVRFAANPAGAGPLQNPWGITQAPANFGAFSNDLLVGNVAGAGNINAYDPTTHQWLGQLRQPNGTPIAIKGLWDLEFGDGTPDSGKTNQLFFDAGPNHPGDSTGGLFGVIHAAGDQGGSGKGDPVREAAAPAQSVQQTLTPPQLQPLVQQALADWQSAGATAAQVAKLRQAPVTIQVLPASYLGEEAGGQVWISPNAAGWGWNLGAYTGRMDLRSVLDHEFGHMLGLADSDNLQDVMGETLAAGVRRLPRASDLGGSGQSSALPFGVLGQGGGAVLSGGQVRPATSSSTSAASSSQAVALVSTPSGPTLGVLAYRVRDQAFADLEGALSVALTPTADPPWTW
jgi:uncharacterized protein (TIGR03118 family)